MRLDNLITRGSLKALAGAKAFTAGAAYFADGAVGRLRARDDSITASVEGSDTYQVELSDEDGELAGECSCPRAGDGYFCKHCVAVGLARLDESGTETGARGSSVTTPKKPPPRDPWQDIRRYLDAQPVESLAELLLNVAQRDDRLYQSLLLKAERTRGDGDVEQVFRRAINDAVQIRGYVDWREVSTYAATIEQVVDSLADSPCS